MLASPWRVVLHFQWGSVPVDPVDLQKGGGPQGEEWRHHVEREEWPRGARVKTAMMARRAAARRWAFR